MLRLHRSYSAGSTSYRNWGVYLAAVSAGLLRQGRDSRTPAATAYKVQPSARKAVEAAAGYAAFSNFDMKIFIAGGGSRKGMAVNNKTKAATYMKMTEIQAGLALELTAKGTKYYKDKDLN